MLHSKNLFSRFARFTSRAVGHPVSFTLAILMIFVWGLTGPFFHFSDTWQLVINTTTTIITFLVVFLIQNTQNRDSEAMQLKLDELIRTVEGAHNVLLDLEELTEEELDRMKLKYLHLAEKARMSLREGQKDTDRPELETL